MLEFFKSAFYKECYSLPCLDVLSWYYFWCLSKQAWVSSPASYKHAYWAKSLIPILHCFRQLPHPWSPVMLYLLSSCIFFLFYFWVWGGGVCSLNFALKAEIKLIPGVPDCSRASNNTVLHKWTSYLGKWFLRHSPMYCNRWAFLRVLGSMMFFFKQKWLYKYGAKRPLTLKYILSAIKYTVFVPHKQAGCSRKQ